MNIKATPVFEKNHESKKRIIVNRGGTRSSKTYSILQLILLRLITGQIDDSGKVFDTGILSIVRKHRATLKGSVLRDREEICVNHDCGFLLQEKHRSKSDMTYSYNGRVVEFFGADDEQKIRGKKRDILYCNEANELGYKTEFFQLFIRTTYKTIIDFNPDDEYVWINTELEQIRAVQDGDVEIIVSTYKNNPFLDANLVKEIERLERTNPKYWNIYGLGNYGKLEGLVFPTRNEIGEIPEGAKLLGYGQDFGYTNDPTTLVAIYKHQDQYIYDEVIYKTGLTNQDIVKEYENNGVGKYDHIVADSAEPKSIEEIYRLGYNIHPSKKGKDSIMYGIDIIKSAGINITSRSSNLKRELKSYTSKKDKNGNNINEPIDSNNHCIDAMRYGSMEFIGPQRVPEFIFG